MAVGAIAAAAAVASSAMKAKGERKAGKTRAEGFRVGAEQAEDAIDTGYNDALKYLSPYAQFGEETLPYLQQMLQNPQQFSYQDFYNSQQFKDMSAQQEEQAARNALATGTGLRSGNASVSLAAIAPQLAMAERQHQDQQQQNRFNNVFQLAQFGSGFGTQAAQAGMNRGNALADYRYNAATGGAGARAQGIMGSYNNYAEIPKSIASAYAGGFGGFGGMNMNTPTYFTDNYGWMNKKGP